MRAPDFWRENGAVAQLLALLGALYGLLGGLRRRYGSAYRAQVPVICVGNLVAGGAGKTPIALSLARLLQDRGRVPHFLTRGYGGTQSGPLRVDPAVHRSAQVGDEAFLLAALAPTWVARNRASGAKAATAAGADVLVMDDGFQNPGLAKDLALLVVDGDYGFGNERVMPAGPLREAVDQAMARAQALVIMGEDRQNLEGRFAGRLPVINASLEPVSTDQNFAGEKLLAFAGIGRPEKFFETLRGLGADLVESRSFADHHPYGPGEIDSLLARARELGATAITTEKDAARLAPAQRSRIAILPVRVAWRDLESLTALLERVCP